MTDTSTAAGAALDPDRLIAGAEAAVGASDWGTPPFRDALEMLCRAAKDDRLEERRLAALRSKIETRLIHRLQMMRDRRTYPQIAAQKIAPPLIVTGLPRGGTTILHAVLSRDPRARSPLNWEVAEPSPPPRAEHFHDDPRFLAAKARMAKIDPALLAMHTMAADLPEECLALFEMAFRSVNMTTTGYLPTYMRWLLDEADMGPAYDFHRQALQHLQAFAPKPFWALKSPMHINWFEALFATYPDARIVVVHRDPAQVLPSVASLLTFVRSTLGPVDPADAGREVFDEWSTATGRLIAYRARHPRLDQFIDVHHVDFLRDPMAVIGSIYGKFGIEMTDEARAAMSGFLADNPSGKHGGHRYSAEEFGLSKAAVHARFRPYIETYGVKLAG